MGAERCLELQEVWDVRLMGLEAAPHHPATLQHPCSWDPVMNLIYVT